MKRRRLAPAVNAGSMADIAFLLLLNKKRMADRPDSPQKAIISLQNDKETSYEAYMYVYSQVQAAYKAIRDDHAVERYGRRFDDLAISDKKETATAIPMRISEADPF